MLRDLVVSNVGVIEAAELSFEDGCTALTGETGAGKTLVVAALSLLLGARADRGLVRRGAGSALIEGRFALPSGHPALEVLGAGVPPAEGAGEVELVVSREVPADGGTTKARVNGRLVPAALLEEAGALLVEVAGQQGHHRLARPAAQRAVLDSFAGPEVPELAARVAAAVRAAARARRDLQEITENERARSREIEVLGYEISEIDAAGVRAGEIKELQDTVRALEHAESIAVAVSDATESLRGDGGAEDALARAATALRRVAPVAPDLGALADRVESVAFEVVDVSHELAGRDVGADPARLDSVRERLSLLSRLTRKYGDDETEVLEHLERSRTRLRELERSEANVRNLEAEVRSLEGEARSFSVELSRRRREAAGALETAATEMFEQLALPGARLSVAVEERALYEGGLESVELRAAMNPGETERPLVKIASGGELSRAALALHILTSEESAPTLVFDEVDAGVGGRAAHAVGTCLARLASERGAQVIVVTHLPQVAAFADHHFRVTKTAQGATVERVDGSVRVAELSRMLAGLPESERAREHAQELLDLATKQAARR
ncbi:MAG: DNA repair protein RecN [Actinomycetota bacterium]